MGHLHHRDDEFRSLVISPRYFSQLQLQSSVHGRLALLHLHRLTQPAADLQPHLISSPQALAASGIVIHTGFQHPSRIVHPQPSGVGIAGWPVGPEGSSSRYHPGIPLA